MELLKFPLKGWIFGAQRANYETPLKLQNLKTEKWAKLVFKYLITLNFCAKLQPNQLTTTFGSSNTFSDSDTKVRFPSQVKSTLRKQRTFGDATTGFPTKWRLRNERRNSILMTRHYPDLGSASDWSCRVGNLIQPIRSTTQICVMKRHQYGISALLSKTSFGGETSGGVAKCRLFSQAK